jgi:RimJ/RimL family protein N-acetyltransferase
LIGSVAVDVHANGDGELGYWYGRAHWGLGYATEAAKAVVASALACPAIRKLIALTDPANEASHRVLLKSGFHMTALRDRDPPSRRGVRCARLYEHGGLSASPG